MDRTQTDGFFQKATLLYKMGVALLQLRDQGMPTPLIVGQIVAVEKLIEKFKAELDAAQFYPDDHENAILVTIRDVEELCYDLREELLG
ncbi:MAG: hypothetical protein DI585_01345 [Pseudomonas fluorescens]|nr:MAG: hypothetical protein DI585_01345 [Pseudomonas fluorescens]